MNPAQPSAPRLTLVQWLICIIAVIGFAFDTYELLMLPLIRSWLTSVKGLPPLRLFFGTAAWLVGAAGGAGLIVHAGGGMILVTLSCLILIWVCVWNAWSLLIANFHR